MFKYVKITDQITATLLPRDLLRRHARGRAMQLALFLEGAPPLPTPPDERDWGQGIDFPLYANDRYGDCLLAGTRIRLADGTSKAIEDMKILDRVVTAEGNEQEVTATMVRHYEGTLVNLRLWGHTHLSCTARHPILTKRGYIQIQHVKTDDWVAMPAYRVGRLTSVKTMDYARASLLCNMSSSSNRRGYAASAAAQGARMDEAIAEMPYEIELDHDFGRLIGLFLAEGSTNQNVVAWSFNADEEDTLVAELLGLLKSVFGIEASISRPKDSVIQVRVSSKLLRVMMESWCGKGAAGKHIHADLMGGPPEFLQAVFSAWMDGDGHFRNGVLVGRTVSRNMAQDLYAIAQALDLRPSISGRQPHPDGIAKKFVWTIKVRPDQKDSAGCQRENNVVWRRVRSVEKTPYVGNVFNISVAVDESYVAEGVGVHNCYYVCAVHGCQSMTGHARPPQVLFNEADIIKYYLRLSGGDNGLSTDQMMLEWKRGLCGGPHKILDDMAINPRDHQAMALAVELFGGLAFTLGIPDRWLESVRPGSIWDAGPGVQSNPRNGHAVWLSGYNKTAYRVETWGMTPPVTLTLAGVGVCDPEATAVFSLDWFNAQGMAPNGKHYTELAQLWTSLGGNNLPPNPFPAPPGPQPTPTPAPPLPGPPAPSPAPVIPPGWVAFVQWIAKLLKQFGPLIVPYLETILEKLPLPPLVISIIEALLEQYVGKKGFILYNVDHAEYSR